MTPGETIKLSPEALKARKRRSLYTALALMAFAALIFAITIAKLGENAGEFSQQHSMEEAARSLRVDGAAPAATPEGETP